MICKYCGNEVQDGDSVCPICNAKMDAEQENQADIETSAQVELGEQTKLGEQTEADTQAEGVVEADMDADTDADTDAELETETNDDAEVGIEAEADTAEGMTSSYEEEYLTEEEIAAELEAKRKAQKKQRFLRLGIPLIVVAAIAIVCVVSMLVLHNNDDVAARVAFVEPQETMTVDVNGSAVPYVPTAVPETVDKSLEFEIDDKLFTYYVAAYLGNMRQQYASYGMNLSADIVNQEGAFDNMIDGAISEMKIVRQLELKADEAGFTLPEATAEDLRTKAKGYIEQSLQEGETFDTAKDTIVQSQYYMTYDEFIDINLRISRVSEFLQSGTLIPGISEDDITKYYEDNKEAQFETRKVKHILIKTQNSKGKQLSPAEIAKKKALANKLASQINKGANLDKLIKKYSEDKNAQTGEVNNNGEYDVNASSQFVEEFKNWAMKHVPEDPAAVVRTTYGYHVMKMSEYNLQSLQEARNTVIGMLILENVDVTGKALTATYIDEGLKNSLKQKVIASLPTNPPVAATAAPAAPDGEAQATGEAN